MHVDMHIVCAYECTRVYIVIVILTQITPHTYQLASLAGSGGVYGTSLIRFINEWACHRKSRGLTGCGTGCHGTHFHRNKNNKVI